MPEGGRKFNLTKRGFMNDAKTGQLNNNSSRPKAVEAVQTAKSEQPDPPSQSLSPETRRKRWYFIGLIGLLLLGAIPIIGYLRQSETAKRLEGLGLAFCAIAWGGFLIRHLMQVLMEEDKLEEQQFNANQVTVPPSNSNTAQNNLAAPPAEARQNIK
jgi:hypothetical protein